MSAAHIKALAAVALEKFGRNHCTEITLRPTASLSEREIDVLGLPTLRLESSSIWDDGRVVLPWGLKRDFLLDLLDELETLLKSDTPEARRGKNIRRLMVECGWSIKDLLNQLDGQHANLNPGNVSRHLNGKTGMQSSTQKEYADALSKGLGRKVSVSELNS